MHHYKYYIFLEKNGKSKNKKIHTTINDWKIIYSTYFYVKYILTRSRLIQLTSMISVGSKSIISFTWTKDFFDNIFLPQYYYNIVKG